MIPLKLSGQLSRPDGWLADYHVYPYSMLVLDNTHPSVLYADERVVSSRVFFLLAHRAVEQVY